jgi:tetratricopeptide (TPR) repeat protein
MTQLLLAILSFAVPQGGNGIRGQVLVPTTQTQGRLEVILEKSDAFYARTFTDAEGHYRFDNVGSGQYAIVIKLEGFEDVHEQVYFGRDGDSTMNITMTRKAGADSSIQALYARYPRNVVDDYQKALDESRKGNTAKAVEMLEGVVKVSPNFQQAHNSLGTLYQKTQRFQEAEKEYNTALQLDTKSSEPLVNLGSLYIQIAEQAQAKRDNQTFGAALDGAVRALNLAIQVQPDSAKAYYLLGTTYYTGGQFPKAEENLTHALLLEKGMGSAELVLANVYIKQQKWRQALEYLDAYLKDNPKAADHEQVQQTRAKVAAQK